jgi:hypothetical protein
MSLPKLYLETTIPSYLTARPSRDVRLAADQLATQEWWDECRHDYELFISQMVLKEARRGDPESAGARLARMVGIPLLGDLREAAGLARRLLADRIVPEVAADDATHIALVAAHGMDYLLTWNCKHIANAEMQSKVAAVCRKSGFEPPIICTPEELSGG